ncbi:MAG: prolyl-tRNA synthetase associated domain-containing protein [Alphaproteobacteria bacterium]|nr:prolyl-tRNA synthetase associated domain-containing protein [Alphaproteobacteria bacterium]
MTAPLTPEQLFAHLDALGIETRTHHHAPVATVDEANAVWAGIDGLHCKNLFLKDAKGKLWLVVARADFRLDLKSLPTRIGSARLSFGSAALLEEVLGVKPGSVTPFAVVNDRDRRVDVVLDAEIARHDRVCFHPLINTMTTEIASGDLQTFLRDWGGSWQIVELP